MDVIEIEQLTAEQANNHWYYDSKYAMIKRHILKLSLDPNQISLADVGTGIGLFLTKLEGDGLASPQRSIGIDPAHKFPTEALGSSIPLRHTFPRDRNYDIMLMMDVLEHVENDLNLINDSVPYLKLGGHLIITVPALPFLMSAHDKFLGHFRRYTINSLRDLVIDSDHFKIINLHYFFASLLPAAIPIRLFNKNKSGLSSDMKPIPKLLNSILKIICEVESVISKHNKIAGLTAVAVCKKIK